MEVLSLYQLNEFIKRVMALNFPEAIWVKGEIAQLSQSNGHHYIQLIEKGSAEGDPVLAENRAIVWSRQYSLLKRRLGDNLPALLRNGMQIKCKVQVQFQERYGMQLIVEDLDPEYTMGQLELQRLQNMEQLRKSGLLRKNALIPLPPAIRRIALLASPQSAGYHDFTEQLHNNPYGYTFDVQLFEMNVQGQLVESQALEHLEGLAVQDKPFDLVAIIRGGGARLDLGAFDSLNLATRVAELPLPVLSGIGHETDETLLDLVAAASLKTPTAVAEYIITHNVRFEAELEETGHWLRQKKQQILHDHGLRIQQLEISLQQSARNKLNQARLYLDSTEALLKALDPLTTLKKGYSLTLKDGKIIKSATALKPGDEIRTRFADGTVESQIKP